MICLSPDGRGLVVSTALARHTKESTMFKVKDRVIHSFYGKGYVAVIEPDDEEDIGENEYLIVSDDSNPGLHNGEGGHDMEHRCWWCNQCDIIYDKDRRSYPTFTAFLNRT